MHVLKPADFQVVLEERSLAGFCAMPTCNVKKESGSNKWQFDHAMACSFCSVGCRERAKKFSYHLGEEPLFLKNVAAKNSVLENQSEIIIKEVEKKLVISEPLPEIRDIKSAELLSSEKDAASSEENKIVPAPAPKKSILKVPKRQSVFKAAATNFEKNEDAQFAEMEIARKAAKNSQNSINANAPPLSNPAVSQLVIENSSTVICTDDSLNIESAAIPEVEKFSRIKREDVWKSLSSFAKVAAFLNACCAGNDNVFLFCKGLPLIEIPSATDSNQISKVHDEDQEEAIVDWDVELGKQNDLKFARYARVVEKVFQFVPRLHPWLKISRLPDQIDQDLRECISFFSFCQGIPSLSTNEWNLFAFTLVAVFDFLSVFFPF